MSHPKRLDEFGQPWALASTFPFWSCHQGRTYLSNNALLLRINAPSRTSCPEAERVALTLSKNRRLVDVAERFAQHDWLPLPRDLLIGFDEDESRYSTQLAGRSLDAGLLVWMVTHLGRPDFAVTTDAPSDPVYFRFDNGFAVLQPLIDENHPAARARSVSEI